MPDWDNQRDMELHPIDEMDGFEGIESLGLGEGDSIYFTPSGTPLRWEFWFENTFSRIDRPFVGRGQIIAKWKDGALTKEW